LAAIGSVSPISESFALTSITSILVSCTQRVDLRHREPGQLVQVPNHQNPRYPISVLSHASEVEPLRIQIS
jgi:hypothetical protein